MTQAIAAALDLDDFGVMKKAVQNGGGRGNVIEQLAPFFDRTVGSHQCGTGLVSAHDDFQQHFARLGREDFQPHVVDQEQIWFEVSRKSSIQFGWRLIGLKFADHIEDGTIENLEAAPDGIVTNGLSQMTLAQTGRPDEQDVAALADKVPRRQLVHLLPFDRWIEGPVEVFQRFLIPEGGRLDAFADEPLVPDVEFVLKDQFQELVMRQLMGAGFLQAHFQAG